MTSSLTDRSALSAHRARASADALFLHARAADDLEDRLALVNRRFTRAAVVTGQPEFWAARMPGAHVTEDAQALDLAEGEHDLVVHALALHWADDPVGQIVQCRRALAPDGLFVGMLLGGETLAGLRAALAEAEAAISGGASPRVAPMADLRDWGALLARAGLALPVADSDTVRVTYADMLALMRDLRAMGEGNALAARHRRTPPRALFPAAAAGYAARHPAGGGRVEALFEIVTLTGWAPHPDQPAPLRPGSATARLSEALGTRETKVRG